MTWVVDALSTRCTQGRRRCHIRVQRLRKASENQNWIRLRHYFRKYSFLIFTYLEMHFWKCISLMHFHKFCPKNFLALILRCLGLYLSYSNFKRAWLSLIKNTLRMTCSSSGSSLLPQFNRWFIMSIRHLGIWLIWHVILVHSCFFRIIYNVSQSTQTKTFVIK